MRNRNLPKINYLWLDFGLLTLYQLNFIRFQLLIFFDVGRHPFVKSVQKIIFLLQPIETIFLYFHQLGFEPPLGAGWAECNHPPEKLPLNLP